MEYERDWRKRKWNVKKEETENEIWWEQEPFHRECFYLTGTWFTDDGISFNEFVIFNWKMISVTRICPRIPTFQDYCFWFPFLAISICKRKRRHLKRFWFLEIIFCITNEITFRIISLSSSDKFFLESGFFLRNYYYNTNYHRNLLRFTLYIRS